MFFHNFKYSFKILFKNKMLIFWTFAFPIILGTFFYLAFSDIENNEKLDIIDIAIVENEQFHQASIYRETFKALSEDGSSEKLFNISYVNEKEAEQLLEDENITGYLLLEERPKIFVSTSGIHETILKYVIEEIEQIEMIFQNIALGRVDEYIQSDDYDPEKNMNSFYAKIYKDIVEMMQDRDVNIKDVSSSNLSYTMIEFYTLIAMSCLYGGILGMSLIHYNLANMSSHGKRVAVSPTSKGTIIFSSVLASYAVQLIGLFLLFIYTIFVLNVDYGTHLGFSILLAIAGSFAGLTMGVMIATLLKTNDNVKTGIIISVTMLCCFLSGMMGITMKYVIDKNVPIINYLNPASMITDGFYSLYYYETLDRFYVNVISLFIFAFIMILISIFSLRRQKYDSI